MGHTVKSYRFSCLSFCFSLYATGYYKEGFLALQTNINKAIYETTVGNDTTGRQRLSELGDNIQLKRHPYPPYNDDKFVLVIQQQFPLILILSFVLVALNVVKDVVHEKERKLKV